MRHTDRHATALLYRRQWMQLLSSGCLGLGISGTIPRNQSLAGEPDDSGENSDPAVAGRELHVRIGVETLRNPFWYAEQGYQAEADQFWIKDHWDRVISGWVAEGYSHLLYWVEPWNKHAWQTFLIRHQRHPEARELTAEQSDKLIEHMGWIFGQAHRAGLKNLLFCYFIVTTPAFAKAHGHDQELPVSASLDFRHNLESMGYHFGVRDESTGAFTEAAIAELFETYENLDGLYGAMGEAVPGKRSTWYRQAVVPGLKRSNRRPVFLVASWMQPLDDFLDDMAPQEVYENTWLAVHGNAEIFTDAKPYPTYARWLERANVPAVVEVMHHNFEAGFPFNSPRLAWEIVHECRRFEHCDGILAWFAKDHPDDLMRKALAYYAKHDVPYSEQPWLDLLEERFGDREAARHFLAAYDASARITPEVGALAWVPHDLGVSRQLLLPYWYWTGESKVLAAVSALIYGFGGPESSKNDAEKLADEAVERYKLAGQFIWEAIDKKSGGIKGRWLDGMPMTLPELIEREKQEREQLPRLFGWDSRLESDAAKAARQESAPKAGTFAPQNRQEK